MLLREMAAFLCDRMRTNDVTHSSKEVGNDTMAWFQSFSAQVSSSHIFGTLGIPATSGLAIGLMV
jgi:hypothetical protein